MQFPFFSILNNPKAGISKEIQKTGVTCSNARLNFYNITQNDSTGMYKFRHKKSVKEDIYVVAFAEDKSLTTGIRFDDFICPESNFCHQHPKIVGNLH